LNVASCFWTASRENSIAVSGHQHQDGPERASICFVRTRMALPICSDAGWLCWCSFCVQKCFVQWKDHSLCVGKLEGAVEELIPSNFRARACHRRHKICSCVAPPSWEERLTAESIPCSISRALYHGYTHHQQTTNLSAVNRDIGRVSPDRGLAFTHIACQAGPAHATPAAGTTLPAPRSSRLAPDGSPTINPPNPPQPASLWLAHQFSNA
jgi:hypothetical protein